MSEVANPQPPASKSSGSRAITTPFLDGALTGGLSLVGMGAVFIYAFAFGGEVQFNEAEWLTLALLVNSPHFMASYRLLYTSKERVLAHRWSTLYVPALLLGVLVWCATTDQPQPLIANLILVNSVYLAWHYTGQAWGMISSFSRLSGIQFTTMERRCIHFGPRALLALHVLFALSGRFPPRQWIDPASYVAAFTLVFQGVCVVVVLSMFVGAWGFIRAYKRCDDLPTRAILPWASLYAWYAFWYFVPGGFMWVQLSHALQYLAFPLRVEVNRYTTQAPRTSRQKWLFTTGIYLALVILGAFILHGAPLAAHAFGEGWYSTPSARVIFMAVTLCVSIHHYFVDGSIWKLSDDRVRRELFCHLDMGEARADR
jgi:hypothetical protein